MLIYFEGCKFSKEQIEALIAGLGRKPIKQDSNSMKFGPPDQVPLDLLQSVVQMGICRIGVVFEKEV